MPIDRNRVLQAASGCYWLGKSKKRPDKQYLKVLCGLTSSGSKVYEAAHRLVCLAVHGPPRRLPAKKEEGGSKKKGQRQASAAEAAVAGWEDFPLCMHLCGYALCLNPMHLAWATFLENHYAHTCPEAYSRVEGRMRDWHDQWMQWKVQQ
jgi:hypothetical protein